MRTPGRWEHTSDTVSRRVVVRSRVCVYVQRLAKKEWTVWLGRTGAVTGYVDVRYTKREALTLATALLRAACGVE